MIRRFSIGFSFLLVTLGFASTAFAQAQPSKGDVGFGYAYLKFLGDEDEHISKGWNVSLAPRGTRFVSAVIDGGGHYVDNFSLHTFQGGVRFSRPTDGKVNPFGQFTVGGGFMHEGSENLFIWIFQPGAGVDIPFKPGGPALRAQVDFPIFYNDGETLNTFRFTVGVVFQLK